MMRFTMGLFAGLLATTAQAAMIENLLLRIEVEQSAISISSRQAETKSLSAKLVLPRPVRDVKTLKFNDPLWGSGQRLVLQHGDRTTTLSLYDGNPFTHLETHIANPSKKPVDEKRLTIANLAFDLGVDAARLNTLGTGGLRPATNPAGSYAYSVLADPATRTGIVCGWLTQRRGVGLMLPSFSDGVPRLETQLDFGLFRIQPGTSRKTDILLIGIFDDARIGLEHYADNIAKVYDIHLPPKPAVYCTWYHRNLSGSGASTEKILAENAAFAKKTLQPFGLSVFQIDDHWQTDIVDGVAYDGKVKKVGPIKAFAQANKNYPSGMAATAANLKAEGFIPGIWYMPFAGNHNNPYFDPEIFAKEIPSGKPFVDTRWSGTSIDSTSPKGEAFLRERVKRIHEWGYRYIKIDGLHLGTPSKNIYVNRTYDGKTFGEAELYDKDMTFIEGYRKGLAILHEESPDTFVLGCTISQNMVSFAPCFGMVDAMRVGPDNGAAGHGGWKQLTLGADFSGNLWFLNNRVWYNDPDPFYVRESNPLDKTRWMVSWQAISGAMNTTSMQYSELSPERLDLIKRTLPPHAYNARPVDILENTKPSVWLVGNDRMHVVGLFNWNEKKEASIDFSIERAGLNPQKQYEAFDFWANRYLGILPKKVTEVLPGAGCRILALREAQTHPQLLSTSRHITQGLIDVVAEAWNPKTKTLSGTSNMVAGDPYEMRIVCPEGLKATATQVGDKAASVSKIEQTGKLVRATITPAATGPMNWSIVFK